MSTNRGTRPVGFSAAMLIACMVFCGVARAASPQLERITPRGGQRGTELDVYFRGQRLKDCHQVLIYEPGISVEKVSAGNTDLVTAHLKISPDARLGEYHVRLAGDSGISELRTFWVGPFATTQAWADTAPKSQGKGSKEAKDNTSFDHPQPLAMNSTVEGVIEDEQIHYYKMDAKKGQRLSVEVEGMRLGTAMFDPTISIVNLDQSEVAACDDTSLLKQDPFISLIAGKDGPLIIEIRDSEFGGNGNCFYRMHVGSFPRPTVCFPLGGPANETLAVKFLGDPSGVISQDVQLPDASPTPFAVFARQAGLSPPSANYVRVVDFPNVIKGESDHNQGFEQAMTAPMPPPVAFNGVIGEAKETDFYKFEARQGQPLEIQVWARRLGSPLDPVLVLYDSKQRYLASSDDAGGPDSQLRFSPPADGEYYLAIRDYLNRGGALDVYRIEITQPKPEVKLIIPNASQVIGPTQERQTIPIPRGGRYGTLIRAARNEVSGDLQLIAKNLPAGVTMTAGPMKGDVIPVLFQAGEDAAVNAKLCDFLVQPVDAKEKSAIEHPFGSDVMQDVALIIGSPNQTVYYRTEVHQLAVAVTKEAPFSVDLVAPTAPLVQSGQLKLKVKAHRRADFKGVITVYGLFDLSGVASQPMQIAVNQNEIEFPISASQGAGTGKFNLGVNAEADVNGQLWVASNLIDLEIAKPYFTGKLQMASVEQGSKAKIICDLTQLNKFSGQATLRLTGLPANSTAVQQQVDAAADKVEFTVDTSDKTSIGRNSSLAVQATLQVNGQEIEQAVAQGGVLRVDPSAKSAVKSDKPKAERADARQ